MRSHKHLSALAFIAASLLAASADAKPRRVVVLDFDGPRQLADTGRSTVMSLLGDQYNIIATKNWDAARARASGRGPQQFRQASKQAGVDAIIEGWVQEEGRHQVLTIAVRDASTGNEVDHVSVRIRDTGLQADATHKLAAQLDDLMGWIDGDISADPTPSIPDIRTMRPLLGSHDPERERERARVDQQEADEAEDAQDDDADEARPRKKHHKRHHKASRDERVDQDDADETDETPAKKTTADDETTAAPEKKKVAAATDDDSTKESNDLVRLFGPDSKEADIVTNGAVKHVPKPTPRFAIAAGPYVSSRGMDFSSDPEAKTPPPSYPGSTIKGFAAEVAVYPFPTQKQDGRISGLGFSFDIKHSVGATITAMDDTGYGDYAIVHSAWKTGVHYRQPIDIVTIDGYANFGSDSHTLGGDFPASVAIPDASYGYLGGGFHIDLQVTDKASVGAGASYQYLLGAGMVTDEDWYGSGKGNGVAAEGDFSIPLPHNLYVKGGIEYRRVKIDFTGSGTLAQAFGAWDMTDSAVIGSGTVGVEF